MVRFDQPCYAVQGAVGYFREHMALGDYLTEHGTAEMTWVGEGAARLGMAGQCELVQFERLCRGLDPNTGSKLMVRDKGAARRVCYFGQISPPKDVSILYLVGGDARIAGWWKDAVAETVREMEAVAATRVRRSGANADRLTANFIGAIVTHDSNRALDPQLHTHLCFMNLTWDAAEGRWKSLQASGFFRHQGYFREVAYNRLALRLREAGYEVEPTRRIGFTIKGLPAALRETFSKRRRAIMEEAASSGATSQDDLQRLALETRARKTNASAAALRARWREECGEDLAALERLVAAANGSSRLLAMATPAGAIVSAENHLFERVSVANDRALLREALVAGRGEVELSQLKVAAAARERAGALIRTGDHLASKEALDAEQEFTGWAHAQRDIYPRFGLGGRAAVQGLSRDQASAVTGVLASTSGVVILQGDAGTGKTTSLKHVVAGIESSGGGIFGCAPTAGAADVLRRELTNDADTLQRLLVDEGLQARIRGRTILVDEAGLVSVRQMRDLCRLAARNDNRLLLVGDVKQHHAVEAGDALRAMQQYARVPIFHLSEILRQRDPAYRRAVRHLAEGDAFKAFGQFKRLGAVQEIARESLWDSAAEDYVRTLRQGKTCLAISPVWKEIHAFTNAARRHLRASGLLASDERTMATVHSLKWTGEEKRRAANYQTGDVLTFHGSSGRFRKFDAVQVARREGRVLVVVPSNTAGAEQRFDPRRTSAFDVGLAKSIPVAAGERLLIRANLPALQLRNGDIVEVSGISPDGAISLRDGRSIPTWFREFSHGYATTSHAAQGRTVDRGILLMADDGIATGNLKQAYVSNSRFRESQMIYTTDQKAAREAMMRPADRMLALELAGRSAKAEEVPVPHPQFPSRTTIRTAA